MTDWNAYFRRIRLGRWTDNGAVCWMPFHGFHHFIAGETDYGKSNTERVILSELSYGIGEEAIEVIGLDAQRGVELQPVQDAGYLKEFYCGDGAGIITPEWKNGKPIEATYAEGLEEHVAQAMDRTRHMRDRGINEWKITKTDPGRVILADEVGQLFRPNGDSGVQKRIITAFDTFTYQMRKCGYVIVAATQQPNLKAIPIRHGFTFGIAHRQGTPLGYQQVTKLGLDFPPLALGVPGLCYITSGGKRVARTQFMPQVLPKLSRARQVNETRIPAMVAANSEPREWLNPTWEGRGGRVWTGGEAEPPGDPHL